MRYVTRPVQVQAVRVLGEDGVAAAAAMLRAAGVQHREVAAFHHEPAHLIASIGKHNSTAMAQVPHGWWLVLHDDRRVERMSDEEFTQRFTPLE